MDWSKYGRSDYKAVAFNDEAIRQINATKNAGGSWFAVAHNTGSGTCNNPVTKTLGHANKHDGHSHTRHLTNQCESDAVKQHGSGAEWFDIGICAHSSKSISRKAASALIAKIPFELSSHIARCFKPRGNQ